MPALSLVSASDVAAGRNAGESHGPALKTMLPGLWLTGAGQSAKNFGEAIVARARRNALYRLTLHGPVPDRVLFAVDDPRSKHLEDADRFLRNRFRFAGHSVDAGRRSIFDCTAPTPEFAAALHGFEWLRHLEVAGGETARKFAVNLTSEWLARYGRYTKPAWAPEVIAARFFNVFAHGKFFLANSDLLWRSRLFVSLRNQARILSRSLDEAPEGLPRLHAAAGLALAGLCLSDASNAAAGLAQLDREIERQILPDGGHVTRSPESLLEAFRIAATVQSVLDAANRETQVALRGALDRMAPMVRFFRMGDGGLALFNGGFEADPRVVTALLAGDEAQGKPFGHAPHSGFQRLAVARALVLMDVGAPPPGAYSNGAHAGCLSFEMSAGAHRIVVNCGAAAESDEVWTPALRATAAHSTLTLGDTSSAALLPSGWLRSVLGPRLVAGAGAVETRRSENAQGILAEASHDFYAARFGIAHRRRLILGQRGQMLTGADWLVPVRTVREQTHGIGIPFAIRFHIHPDIRLSLAQGGGSVILKLPNGEGWRFRSGGGALSIEESVYLGGGTLRRTEQLVVSGHVKRDIVECAWVLEQVGAG